MRLRNKFILGFGTITLASAPLVTSAVVEKNADDIKEFNDVQENVITNSNPYVNVNETSEDQFYELPEIYTEENEGLNAINQQLSELAFLKDYYHLNEKPMPRNSYDNEWFIETFELAARSEIKEEWIFIHDNGNVELSIPNGEFNELINYSIEIINIQNELNDLQMMQSRSWQWFTLHSWKKWIFRWYYAWDLRISKNAINVIDECVTIGKGLLFGTNLVLGTGLTIAGAPTWVISLAITVNWAAIKYASSKSNYGVAMRNFGVPTLVWLTLFTTPTLPAIPFPL